MFTGGGISGTNITGTSLNISGISTLGTLQVSNDVNVVGVLTAERLYSNVFGEFTGGGISGTNIDHYQFLVFLHLLVMYHLVLL